MFQNQPTHITTYHSPTLFDEHGKDSLIETHPVNWRCKISLHKPRGIVHPHGSL